MIFQINHFAEVWGSWMWAMVWQTAVVVAILWVLDLLVRRWVWPQVRYAMWLLVLVKLFLPPGFSSPASVTQPLGELPRRVQIAMPQEKVPVAVPMGREEIAALPPVVPVENQESMAVTKSEPVPPAKPTGSIPSSAEPRAATAPVTEPTAAKAPATGAKEELQSAVYPKITWKVYLMLGWVLGVWIFGGWLMVKLQELARTVRNGDSSVKPAWFDDLLKECGRRLNLRRLPAVVFTRSVRSPAVYGVIRPVLLMPAVSAADLSRQDGEHILLHELAHIKRGDLLVHAVFMTLQIFYWFHPLLWLVRRQLQHLRELCCDATVARLLRENTVQYRQTLLETARALLAEKTEPGMGLLGLFEDANRLRARLSWLEKKSWKYRPLQIVSILAVVAVMLACVLPMARAKNESQTQPEKTENKIIATLPNGVTVELVGVCEYPSEGKSWWLPDGTALETVIKTRDRSGYTSKDPGYEFVFRKTGEGTFQINRVKGSDVRSGIEVLEPEGLEGYRFHIKRSVKKTDIQLAWPSGQWETVITSGGGGSVSGSVRGKTIILAAAVQVGDDLIVSSSDELDYQEASRIIVMDREDREHTGSISTDTGVKGIRQRTIRFPGMNLKDVSEIRFQICPYEYAAFENVSLRRGEKTQVQVGMENMGPEAHAEQLSRPNIFIMGSGMFEEVISRVHGRVYNQTGRNHEKKNYDEIFNGMHLRKDGDILVLLLNLDNPERVPAEYADVLPRPWNEIEAELKAGKNVELLGSARDMQVLLLAAPQHDQLRQAVRDSQYLNNLGAYGSLKAPELLPQRYFVRLVVGPSGMTWEGEPITWAQLPERLEAVKNRNSTVLEFAYSDDAMAVQQVNEAKFRVMEFSKQYGFEYISEIGKQMLGTKGSPLQDRPEEKSEGGITGGNVKPSAEIQPVPAVSDKPIPAITTSPGNAAVLNNGMTVELVGVCNYFDEQKKWWAPDGTLLPEPPIELHKVGYHEGVKSQTAKDNTCYLYVMKRFEPSKPHFLIWDFTEKGELSTFEYLMQDSEYRHGFFGRLCIIPSDRNQTDIILSLIPEESWKTVFEISPKDIQDGKTFQTRTDFGWAAFSGNFKNEENPEILMVENLLDYECRLVAADLGGKFHYFPRSSTPEGIVDYTRIHAIQNGIRKTWPNYDLPLPAIDKFLFQISQAQKITFRNVSLRPGEKTSVQIEVEGKNQEPAIRQADWLDRWQEKANGHYDRLAEAYRAQDWEGVKEKTEQLQQTMAEFRAAMAEQYQEIKPQLDQKLAELREEANQLAESLQQKKTELVDPAYEKLAQKWQEFKVEQLFDKAEKLFQESKSLPADQRDVKLNEAIGLYRQAYEMCPQSANMAGSALMMIGLCYDWMGKRAEEIAALELAVEKYPDRSPAAYYYLGSAYRQAGQKDKAIEMFRKCISLCGSKTGFPYTAAMQELRGMGAPGYDGGSALLSNQRPKLWEIGAANEQCNEFDTDPRNDAEVVSYEIGQDWKQFPAGLGTDIGKQRSAIEIHFTGAVPQENDLKVVWSAGGSESVEQFQVELDGIFVAKSESRKGASPPVWQAERFTLPAQPEGSHTLRLKHLSGDGLELDYLALEGVAKPNVAAEEEKIPGSTVDFRIAPKKGSGEIRDDQVKQYLETLLSQGSKPADSQASYQWFPVKEGNDTIFTKDLIFGEYQGIRYVLLHTQKPKVMLHTEDWGVNVASLQRDSGGNPQVALFLDAKGADLMGRLSEANIDEYMALLVDGKIVSIPMIKSKVQYHVGIIGSFTEDEASRIAKAIWIGMPSTDPKRPMRYISDKVPPNGLYPVSLEKESLKQLFANMCIADATGLSIKILRKKENGEYEKMFEKNLVDVIAADAPDFTLQKEDMVIVEEPRMKEAHARRSQEISDIGIRQTVYLTYGSIDELFDKTAWQKWGEAGPFTMELFDLADGKIYPVSIETKGLTKVEMGDRAFQTIQTPEHGTLLLDGPPRDDSQWVLLFQSSRGVKLDVSSMEEAANYPLSDLAAHLRFEDQKEADSVMFFVPTLRQILFRPGEVGLVMTETGVMGLIQFDSFDPASKQGKMNYMILGQADMNHLPEPKRIPELKRKPAAAEKPKGSGLPEAENFFEIYISGQVKRPGPYRGSLEKITLRRMIATAGPAETDGLIVKVLRQKENGEYEKVFEKAQVDVIAAGAPDFALQAGDNIVIETPPVEGSVVVDKGFFQDKATRTEQKIFPLEAGAELQVRTINGSITVTGEDRRDCDVKITIEAKAKTPQRAEELAKKVQIQSVTTSGEFKLYSEDPPLSRSESLTVNFELQVPAQMAAQFRSNNGTIELQSISGKIQAQANNGKITVVGGTFDLLQASLNNGEITAKEISGKVNCTANNGKAAVAYAESADSAVNAEVRVNNGAIDFTGPKNLSASVMAETDLGSIESDWPMDSSGFLGKRLSGTIGEGKGKIYLKNNTGAIRIHKR